MRVMATPPVPIVRNWDTDAARRYHDGTKHPHGALLNRRHRWDGHVPPRQKVYPTLDPIPLPADAAPLAVPALEAIARSSGPRDAEPEQPERLPDRASVARLLFFSAGITKQIRRAGRIMAFRAAAATGALYHVELYLVCGALPGLRAGVYHYAPEDGALRLLRPGDHRHRLIEASAGEPGVSQAPAILVATDVVWRNAVKYRERAYRHAFWDSGTILSNALAVAAAHELPARVVLGFVDSAVSRLLDLDPSRELPLVLMPIGTVPGESAVPDILSLPEVTIAPLQPLHLETLPVPEFRSVFPAIGQIHDASSLHDAGEVDAWRAAGVSTPAPHGEHTPHQLAHAPSSLVVPLRPNAGSALPPDPLDAVIVRRGSARAFARRPITLRQLSAALDRALRPVNADFQSPPAPTATPLNDVYLIVNAVEGLDPGIYVLRREAAGPSLGRPENESDGRPAPATRLSLECLRAGEYRREAHHLALDQDLAGDASVNVYFLADLDAILDRLGNRGYRAAQLEAGIAGGRLYLAAYAQRLGATGLTFYDDEVTAFFSPHARGKSVTFLMALGHRARRARLI